ncbi:hypothetical protein PMIN06_001092 [Paraphaeosphaeria minitans]|uniref:Uncharacterized protein n=1 Tax=Paraphaeosphaeria minitans TaxID=565426 RepID=A0A9P6GQV9_9PLEO|nr:hypothetical protein PMIN01_02119 [Paraphaeosphaeria minitans]
MDGCISEVVNAAITQTGGIEDILKAAIAQATQQIRRENATLKTDLDSANRKIAWLDDLIQHEEGSKARALQEQRSHYLQIGGPVFRRVVLEEEMQQAMSVHEIASLETQFLGNHNHGHGWSNGHYDPIPDRAIRYGPFNNSVPSSAYNVPPSMGTQAATPATRARSSTTVAPIISPSDQPIPNSPTRRAQASTLIESGSRPLNPIVGRTIVNAGLAKPPIDSLAVAPAPHVHGLRNAQGRYESPIICAKCHKIFALNSWIPEHYKNCKGPDEVASPAFATHSMPNLTVGQSDDGFSRPEINQPTTERPEILLSGLPFRTSSRTSKAIRRSSVQQ